METPDITVRFYAVMRLKAGAEQINCHAAKLRDVLDYLKRNYDAEFMKILDSCHIYVNSDNAAQLKGPDTRLKSGDVLHILPPTGGG